jgi:hypothetical protein
MDKEGCSLQRDRAEEEVVSHAAQVARGAHWTYVLEHKLGHPLLEVTSPMDLTVLKMQR